MSPTLCQALCWAGCGGSNARLPGAPSLAGGQSQVDLVVPHWAYRDEMRFWCPLPCRGVGWGVACGVDKLQQVLFSFKFRLHICKAGVNNSSHPIRLFEEQMRGCT